MKTCVSRYIKVPNYFEVWEVNNSGDFDMNIEDVTLVLYHTGIHKFFLCEDAYFEHGIDEYSIAEDSLTDITLERAIQYSEKHNSLDTYVCNSFCHILYENKHGKNILVTFTGRNFDLDMRIFCESIEFVDQDRI